MAEHDEKVDFVGYASRTPDRLYSAVKELMKDWDESGRVEWVQLLDSVLEADDREKIRVA